MKKQIILHRLYHFQMREHISTYISDCTTVDKEKGIEIRREK